MIEGGPDDQHSETIVINCAINHDPSLIFQENKCRKTPAHKHNVVRFQDEEVQQPVEVGVVENVTPLGQDYVGVEASNLQKRKMAHYLFVIKVKLRIK